MIQKRFPADTSMEELTFLNNRKIDAELYALLQLYSYPDGQKRTVVKKVDLPIQREICEKIGIKSAKTLRVHLSYLIDQGYIIEEGEKYILPNKEEIFLMIPLKTIQLFNDVFQEDVIKVYIYLGQRWKYKGNQYVFTLKEIGEHIGLVSKRQTVKLNNILETLKALGLIDYQSFYEANREGNVPVPKKRLVNFSFEASG